jgi:arylsulfatase A-like enzyme
VLDTLREQGLDERTLVFFTSDNGGTARAINAPLRGGKGTTWEGGVRVPTLARWLGKIPAGMTCDAVTGVFDILPTCAALAGAKVPADRKIDGANIWPLLAGEPVAKPAHDTFYYYRGLTLEAVRQGDWKLRLVPKENQALYNLQSDIGETTDVAAQNPEVVKRLQALADAMKDDLGLTDIGPGCRPLGRVETAGPLMDRDGKVRQGFEP